MFKKKIAALILSVFILAALSAQTASAAFSDVPDGHPYKAAIDFCEAKGFVNGIGGGLFSPDGSLTRMHLAVVWCRLLGAAEENHGFSDVTPLKNSYDTVAVIMNSFGILTGTQGSKFSPYANLTREQLAVVVMRTFGVGVADKDDYKAYSDHALISDWARDAVSACLNAGVFSGLYNDPALQPQKAVTRAEICQMIYNLSQPAYTVTIGELTGGKITALPTVARPGTTITLTVTPDEGKRLKAGTLKFNDTVIYGNTFTMPAEDVLVTAEFEDKPVLESISVTSPPAKTEYTVGEKLDLSGIVVTAYYSNGDTAEITNYTAAPPAGSDLTAEGSMTITVSYTEGGITKETTFTVQVSAAPGG